MISGLFEWTSHDLGNGDDAQAASVKGVCLDSHFSEANYWYYGFISILSHLYRTTRKDNSGKSESTP